MKCHLCNRQPPNQNELREYYITFHRINPNNWFFKNLFKCQNKIFRTEKCLQCEDFTPTLEIKTSHDFIKHYKDGQVKPFEQESIDIERGGLITKYEISADKHGHEYDFQSAESAVDNDFLRNVKNRFVLNNDLITKVGFSIGSYQPAPQENDAYWSIEPYKTKYFNDYVFFSLKENIEKRVIVNGMIGSSWQFRRFVYINLLVLQEQEEYFVS